MPNSNEPPQSNEPIAHGPQPWEREQRSVELTAPHDCLHREESAAHSGSSVDSTDHFLPSCTASRDASRRESGQPAREESGDGEHSDVLTHGTQQHSETHSKGDAAFSNTDGYRALPKEPRKKRVNPLHAFKKENIKVTAVSIICGLLTGYAISVVPFYSQLFITGTNCAMYTARKGCESVPFADCVWKTSNTVLSDGTTRSLEYCGWRSITCRAAYPNDGWVGGGGNTTLAEMHCLQDERCTWSYSDKECQNPSGYTTSELGIFAGSMILGNMFGALLGGPLVTSMGSRLTFLVSGIYSIVACIMGHMDSYINDFWVLIVSRFVLGIFMGLITVACPLYVHENAIPKYKEKIGSMFQIFATIGGLICGVIGLGLGESIRFDEEADQHISARMQGVTAGQTFLAIFLLLLGIFSAETKVKFKKGEAGALDQNEYSYSQMAPRLLMVLALDSTFRFTGFNALANFCPKLMSSFNIAPFIGTFIIMVLNCFGALFSVPASLVLSSKSLFLIGSCCISCMCLFLCGIPVYPGVASEAVMNGCAVVGICLFIFCYEMFVGPSFYVICQQIFPPSFRPRGSSFAQWWQFVFNLVINVCYSTAVEHFSGGPGGDQHKGQSVIFIFFGGLGLICFVYEFCCLDLWDEAAEAERKRQADLSADTGAVPGGEGDCSDELQPAGSPEPLPTEAESIGIHDELSRQRNLDEAEMEVRL